MPRIGKIKYNKKNVGRPAGVKKSATKKVIDAIKKKAAYNDYEEEDLYEQEIELDDEQTTENTNDNDEKDNKNDVPELSEEELIAIIKEKMSEMLPNNSKDIEELKEQLSKIRGEFEENKKAKEQRKLEKQKTRQEELEKIKREVLEKVVHKEIDVLNQKKTLLTKQRGQLLF